jgi:hypothetical protein
LVRAQQGPETPCAEGIPRQRGTEAYPSHSVRSARSVQPCGCHLQNSSILGARCAPVWVSVVAGQSLNPVLCQLIHKNSIVLVQSDRAVALAIG